MIRDRRAAWFPATDVFEQNQYQLHLAMHHDPRAFIHLKIVHQCTGIFWLEGY